MRRDMHIMLVEDDYVDVKTVQRAFRINKITNPLHVAGDGEQALAYLEKTTSGVEPRPGLILLDLNMPVMNGIEFLKVVKADDRFKNIPIIVLTTSKEESDRVESFNFSVAGYIIKPVDFENFKDAIKIIDLYWTLSQV